MFRPSMLIFWTVTLLFGSLPAIPLFGVCVATETIRRRRTRF